MTDYTALTTSAASLWCAWLDSKQRNEGSLLVQSTPLDGKVNRVVLDDLPPTTILALDEDCCEFLSAASSSLPAAVGFRAEDCPFEAGFAMLARPLPLGSPPNHFFYGMDFAGFFWRAYEPGLVVDGLLGYPTDPKWQKEIASQATRQVSAAHPEADQEQFRSSVTRYLQASAGRKVTPLGYGGLTWGDVIDYDYEIQLEHVQGKPTRGAIGAQRPDMLLLFRRLWTLWAIIRGEMGINATRSGLPRPARRRLGRAGYGDIQTVTICTLPRPSREEAGGSAGGVNWTHRWIVSGHWCNHWWPKQQVHKPRWISPYVKGPGDKPLVMKERRFVVVRPEGGEDA
jgi:hypothetical protein